MHAKRYPGTAGATRAAKGVVSGVCCRVSTTERNGGLGRVRIEGLRLTSEKKTQKERDENQKQVRREIYGIKTRRKSSK